MRQNISDIDYNRVFSSLDTITGLPLRRVKNRWEGKVYIDGTPHKWNSSKTRADMMKDGGIVILEQGGEVLSIWKWMLQYGGCNTDKEVAAKLKGLTASTLNVPTQRPEIEIETKYVPKEVLRTAKLNIGFLECGLFKFFCQYFERQAVIDAFKRYNCVPYRLSNGEIITRFFYVRDDGKILHDKLMRFSAESGKRDKSFNGRVYKSDKGFTERCYYGENLLEDNDLKYIVESEKSAIGIYLHTGRITLATGGSKNIKRVRKNFVMLPDYDSAGAEWVQKFGSRVVEWWKNEQIVEKGDDFWDYILKKQKK